MSDKKESLMFLMTNFGGTGMLTVFIIVMFLQMIIYAITSNFILSIFSVSWLSVIPK